MNSNRQNLQTTQIVPPLHRHNKRSASNMSSHSPQPSSDSDTQDDPEQQPPHNNEDNGFLHHIKPTFLGPVCTACHCKVANGNILFYISRNSIKNHLTTNKCYSGDIAVFKARQLEKTLRHSMVHYHNSFSDNPSLASRAIEKKYHFCLATKNLPYCANCGFVGTQLCHVRRHTMSQYTECSESDMRSADGSIMINEYGFLIPRVVLKKIGNGTFSLPHKSVRRNTRGPTQSANSQIPPQAMDCTVQTYHQFWQTQSTPTRPLPISEQHPTATNNSIHPTQTRFLPSDADIFMAVSNNSPFKDTVSLNSFARSELVNTFVTKEQADQAYEYLTSYILLINQQKPGRLRNTLANYSTMIKPNIVNTTLHLLLQSGKLWLQSSAANMDVRMVPVHHRNNIYHIGNTQSDNEKDLLKGGTFVWSDNNDTIADQFASLISFAYEIKWPIMTTFLEKVQQVYLSVIEDHTIDNCEDEYAIASAKMVDTNIIFGLLTEILLEEPAVPNGPNLIYKYLAGCTIKQNHNGTIIVRNPNEISKNANALLRLLRHGVCSLYVRRAQLMVQQKESHKTFEVWANGLIRDMQVCPSVGHICRTIRTAREVDRKTPSLVHKAFNDRTGELFVGGSQIHKSTWSVAIPTAIAEWDRHFNYLFPNHSQASNLPLHHIFHLNNDIVLAGQDSFLSIAGIEQQSIPLTEFKPTFPQ
jgi:hypothetical protein